MYKLISMFMISHYSPCVKKFIRALFFCFYLLQLCSLSYASEPSKKIALHSIHNQDEFLLLRAEPESSTLARTETLKFMIDRRFSRNLWFFNTEKYSYHYAFARDYLSTPAHPVADHAIFNRREYSSTDRRFEMGTIVYYKDQDIWALQLIAGDTLTAEEIARLFVQVKAALWIGPKLRFLPMSIEQEAAVKMLTNKLPLVTAEEVFKGIHYQPLIQGRAVGYLRIVKGTLDPTTVKPNQILVLEKLPEEIPVSAAIISQELQAPLAHIVLLCGSRSTPDMGLRDALVDKNIQELDGSLVELNVQPQQYSLHVTTLDVANIFWKKLHPEKLHIPTANLKEKRLVNVSDLKLQDSTFAGAKAAQLGEVASIRPTITTPGGFVVPLAYYFDHLANPKISVSISNMVASIDTSSAASTYQDLEKLRSLIESIPVDPTLIANIKINMSRIKTDGRWILRSSTNAEDLAGFNGAGLYRSIKINSNASDAEVADALRKVWSSVWLQAAFDERNWYGIDHRSVGMAVLVQPFVEGAIASGVAITANPFAEFRPGVLINAQVLGGSVTGAAGNEIPEQHLVYTFSEELEFELLSKSSRVKDGKALLDKKALTELTNELVLLHKHFLPRWNYRANAVDVEFLLTEKDNKVVILQARPYNVIYGKEQKMSWITN